MALDISRFIERFVEEARDHLPRLREGLRALENGGRHSDEINALFRAVHTLKGSSRMLRLNAISALMHAVEELLSTLREHSQKPAPATLSRLNQAIDLLDTQVDRLAQGHPPETLPPADPALLQAMAITPEDVEDKPATASPDTPGPNVSDPLSRLRQSDTVRVRRERLDDLIHLMGEVLSGHHHLHDLVHQARALGAISSNEHESSWRAFHREFKQSVHAQDTLMSELHDRALQMRMLPLAVVFDPLAQMASELAQTLRKQAVCRVVGREIELDRQVIDRLSEPLVHLLRNALDHGIEPPDLRRQAGKARQGLITLKAWQEGRQVVIELCDDGAGINSDALRQQARAQGLMTDEQLDALSEQEALELIFAPGFSTRATVTDISGRGVGMDVVKRTVVDELSGDVRLTTQAGKGSTFTLRLPLSLALMRVLLIRVGKHTFGVGAPHVVELLDISSARLIDTAGQRALMLNDELVAVTPLAPLLGLEETPQDARLRLLIVRLGDQRLALIVDDVIDERDMVIKALPEHLDTSSLVSSMASTGRNALVSVLHIPALLTHINKYPPREPAGEPLGHFSHRILIVDDSLNTREIEKDVLEAWGYRVSLAENGQDGFEKALADTFDAVLTDVEMPVMDGFTLTARLRENERYRHVPIIIVTSREKEADRQRGIEVGADAYIVKGNFDQNNLVDTLKALLG